MKSILTLHQIHHAYGAAPSLKGVTLALYEGELLSLLGPSGCGKSTCLRLIAGFEKPSAGEIHLQGKLVANETSQVEPEQRKIGMVFQDIALFPHLSLVENVAFGLTGPDRIERAMAWLKRVRLAEEALKLPSRVSGGQQQRAALARALAPQPSLILLDEPFSSLDAKLRAELAEEVRDLLKAQGTAAILVTHDQEEAFGFSDRIALLNQGKIVQQGHGEMLYHQPATPWAAAFSGQANFFAVRHGQTLFGPAPQGASQLMVRPEDFEVQEDEAGLAKVKDLKFQGHHFLIKVEWPDGETALLRLTSNQPWRPGARLRLTPKQGLYYAESGSEPLSRF